MNNTDVNFNSYILLPSIDALQEFKIQSGIYSAEFGRGIGQVNVVTKSGTNDYHGTVWEFIRNNKLDALPYAFGSDTPKSSPFKWNQYGFTLGGPVQIPRLINGRNKLFFMANYEGFRLRNQKDTLFSVPSAAMRRGDFSQISAAVRDPLTGAPFPGNIIPSTRLDPISVKMLEYYPLPNQPTSALANNYLAVNKNSTDKNQINVRIDFTESSKSSWYGRYGWTDEGQFTGGIYLNGGTVDTRGQQALIDNTRVLSSTLVNEIRFGYNRFYNAAGTELNNVFDPIAQVGLKLPTTVPANAWGLPSIGIAGFSGFGPDSNSPYINQNQNWQYTQNLSWNHGSHFVEWAPTCGSITTTRTAISSRADPQGSTPTWRRGTASRITCWATSGPGRTHPVSPLRGSRPSASPITSPTRGSSVPTSRLITACATNSRRHGPTRRSGRSWPSFP